LKPEISIILPTLNEEKNIGILLPKIQHILKDYTYEVIVVDDSSTDKTRHIAEEFFAINNNGFVLYRDALSGLSSAIYDGFNIASGNFLIVMDADLQHDEEILPEIINKIATEKYDLCIASRNIENGGYGNLILPRKLLSKFGIWLANFILNMKLSDPMSGYFGLSRKLFEEIKHSINPRGFKLLLEILYKSMNIKIAHVPYNFKVRKFGKTKLTLAIGFEYLLALLDLKLGWVVSYRFIIFGFVGFIGSCLNFSFFITFIYFDVPILWSVFYAASLGMIWSFLANNFFTFSEYRYSRKKILLGLFFYLFLSLPGIFVQISVTSFLSNLIQGSFYLSDYLYFIYLVAVICGAALNYIIHLNITWKKLGYNLYPPSKRE
jgi:dolichol-phosphate mannosyltransferase